jgi:hypothetical protein
MKIISMKYKTLKLLFWCLLLFTSNNSFAQSKKKRQIALMAARIDELNHTLDLERNASAKKLADLKGILYSMTDTINKLKTKAKAEKDDQGRIIASLQNQLKLKSDSLDMLKEELVKKHDTLNQGKLIVSREFKIGDRLRDYDDPISFGWEKIDMTPHYALYRTTEGLLISIGVREERRMRIETIDPRITHKPTVHCKIRITTWEELKVGDKVQLDEFAVFGWFRINASALRYGCVQYGSPDGEHVIEFTIPKEIGEPAEIVAIL